MPIPGEDVLAIGAALKAKGVGSDSPCPLCGQRRLALNVGGFVTLTLSDQPLNIGLSGPGFPLAALVCQNCGNTMLLNLYTLGLTEMVERLQEKPKEATSDG